MSSSTPQDPPNMEPSYEVKLLMHSDIVLDSDKKLALTVRDTFGITKAATKMNIQFVDTNEQGIYKNGWSLRIRKTEGKPNSQLTYKKRYKVADGKIDDALTTANKDGFDATTTIYESQIDWGYENQTLSINRDEPHEDSVHINIVLPGEEDSRQALIAKAPEKFNHSVSPNWGTELLKGARVYGPIGVERYTGLWEEEDEEVDIEVWPIKDADGTGLEYIVEASFKVKKRTKALEKQKKLIKLLEKKGWFAAKDSLKTALVMNRY